MEETLITDFVGELKLPGKLIFAKVWGSYSHNTQLPTSDVDYSAVYAVSIKDFLSLNPPPETVEMHKPDCQAHELIKFCRLLLKGNPGILEMLFTEKMVYETDAWIELKAHRKSFLTQVAVKQYLGYAQGQMAKLKHHAGKAGLHTKGGAYNEKWAYHMIRILNDALRIARGQEPVVWKTGMEHKALMAIRKGEIHQTTVEENAVEIINDIEELKPWAIPEEGDKDFLNDWVFRIRKEGL